MAKRGTHLTPEHRGKMLAASQRVRRQKKRRQVQLSSGRDLAGVPATQRVQVQVNSSPAAWKSVHEHVGDCEYVDCGLDDVLLRALHDRVVYADRLCHHEPCFKDITTDVLIAVDKQFRKNGKRVYGPPHPPVATGLLKPFKLKEARKVKKAPKIDRRLRDIRKIAKVTGYREGRSLTDVVGEMFEQ